MADFKRDKNLSYARLGLALSAALLLGGCVDRDMSDLQQYVEEVMARRAPEIGEIPDIPPYETYTYRSDDDDKDPFKPFFEKPSLADENRDQPRECAGPDEDRLKEELESYPLDSLRMVGTIERGEDLFGVILSTEGAIHRVSLDNYMGRNHGRIIDIREEAIEIIEIVPDGQGCWQERNTEMALVE